MIALLTRGVRAVLRVLATSRRRCGDRAALSIRIPSREVFREGYGLEPAAQASELSLNSLLALRASMRRPETVTDATRSAFNLLALNALCGKQAVKVPLTSASHGDTFPLLICRN